MRGLLCFADMVELVAEQLDGVILVAHNLPFEQRFLGAEFQRAGRSPPVDIEVCTLEADRLIHNAGRRKLQECCAAAGIDTDGPAHRALADDARARPQTSRGTTCAGHRRQE